MNGQVLMKDIDLRVLQALRSREYGMKCIYRRNLKIMKALICRSNFVYKKVWEKQSKKSIACERGLFFFEHFRECYSGYTKSLGPRLCYQLTDSFPYGKIEDAVVCEGAVDPGEPWQPSIHRNSLFAITHDNKLVRFDLQTGRILRAVSLPSRYCFRKIAWETEAHTLVVKSTQLQMNLNVIMVLTVFDVFPLNFVAMMEIPKSVFGRQVSGASISQGLLFTMHTTGVVKLYSFTDILHQITNSSSFKQYKIKPQLGEDGNHMRETDINILIRDEPPVLFELKCADHLIEIGGSPWHYMYSPPNQEGIFHVRHLVTHTPAGNGLLDFQACGLECHRAVFHSDESGRILHIGDDIFRVYQICCGEDGSSHLEECFSVTMTASVPSYLPAYPEVTKSGRLVKRRSWQGYAQTETMSIDEVDYENELDLLCVTSIHRDESLTRPTVIVGFYDNLTGQLVKETPLEQPWESFYEHRVSVDLDTIVQTIKPNHGLFRCTVYRLVRADSGEESRGNRNSPRRGRSRRRKKSAHR